MALRNMHRHRLMNMTCHICRQIMRPARPVGKHPTLLLLQQRNAFQQNFASRPISTGQMKVLSDCLEETTFLFENRQISEPRTSAEYIIAFALGHKTLHNIKGDKIIDATTLQKIAFLAERRLKVMPVQYVIEEWDFRDITITCRPPVFIPRPETEEFVGHALNDPVVKKAKSFLEIGPGTGVISLSILSELPQLHATVVDQSLDACQLTKENAKSLGLADRISIIHDTFSPEVASQNRLLTGGEKFDFLISNPPYIPSVKMSHLQPEIFRYEDHQALESGKDGMDLIREILQVSQRLVKSGGSIWLEADPSHPDKMEEFLSQHPEYNVKLSKSGDSVRRYSMDTDKMTSTPFCHLQVISSSV